MRYLSHLWILCGVLLWIPPAPAAKPAPDEFPVPLQATPVLPPPAQRGASPVRTIKDPLTGEPALQAKLAQDAIAAAIKQRAAGCRMIRFGTGFGWVATGAASYPASEDPGAVRRSAQQARFKAFMDARTRLAGCLSALSPEARQRVAQNLEQDDAIRLALINLAANDEEKREQALKILARGFVAYSATDDPVQRMVYVNLVTTPKTAFRLTRPTANAVEAASLQEGLRQAQAEIGAGLIPTAGNRLIAVNATGELALVGYATHLVGTHPDPATQDKLRADAEKIATVRAAEALVQLATGEEAGWKNGFDPTGQDDSPAATGDYDESEPSARRFGKIRDLVMTSIKDDAGFQALREGRLPSAVTVKRLSGENTVSVVAIYTPAIKKREPKPASSPATPTAESISFPLPLPAEPAPESASTPPAATDGESAAPAESR